MPPRPMLSEELNITYRKIPIIAIDGQFYIDTSLIPKALDETFGGIRTWSEPLTAATHFTTSTYP